MIKKTEFLPAISAYYINNTEKNERKDFSTLINLSYDI